MNYQAREPKHSTSGKHGFYMVGDAIAIPEVNVLVSGETGPSTGDFNLPLFVIAVFQKCRATEIGHARSVDLLCN